MNIIERYRSQLDKKLHEKNAFTDSLALVEAKTKVQRLYLVAGLIAFNVLYLIVGYGAQFLANFIGFLYPAYCSVKAIETKEKDDDTKWLTYWVVYAGFALLEFFTDIFLFWIPLYALLKCAFLLYLMAPTSWNGSVMIYYKIIRPFILKHQVRIDATINKASELASEIAAEVFGLSRIDVSLDDNTVVANNDDEVSVVVETDMPGSEEETDVTPRGQNQYNDSKYD